MAKKYSLSRKNADKHLLYQWSVQDPDLEVEFAAEQYRKRRGRKPLILREDFCGTALVAREWVKGNPKRRVIGLDLDEQTLQWARRHNIEPLGKDAARVDLRLRDVRSVTSPKADIIAAMNFSYYIFFPLTELTNYFRFVRRSLAPGGIFILDCFGGWKSQQIQSEQCTVKCPDGTFGYVWDTADYDPINNRVLCHIHFEFKNGKRWKNAFTYDWRLYTPAEVRDALTAAGFSNIQVFWDFEDDKDHSDYRPAQRAKNAAGWITYIVADGEADVSHNGSTVKSP
jgi:SAM-dependent methyltransferase